MIQEILINCDNDADDNKTREGKKRWVGFSRRCGGESTCFGDGEEQTTTLAEVLFLMLTRVLMSVPFFQNLPEYHLSSAIGPIRVH